MSTQPTEESLDRRLGRLDAQIKIEFDLIGHRVSWLLVSNSFLFTALAVALNNTSNDTVKLRLVNAALWCLPTIGLFSSFLVVLAVAAAHNVIKDLKLMRK